MDPELVALRTGEQVTAWTILSIDGPNHLGLP